MNATVREWVVASWALGNANASAVYISCTQCYGVRERRRVAFLAQQREELSGLSQSYVAYPEYSAALGAPLGPRTTSLAGLWYRAYTGGVVLLNPVGRAAVEVRGKKLRTAVGYS